MKEALQITLTLEDRATLEDLRQSTDSGLARRATIALLAAEGMTNAAIAAATGVSAQTVANWRTRFQAEGVPGLGSRARGGPERVVGANGRTRSYRPKVITRCSYPPCNKEILASAPQFERSQGNYCSQVCRGKHHATSLTLTCEVCGQQFSRKLSQQSRSKGGTFCSRACFYAGTKGKPRARRRPPVITSCARCGEPVPVAASRFDLNENTFCGTACRDAAKSQRVERFCEVCGMAFAVKPSVIEGGGGRYCSDECRHIGIKTSIEFHCAWCGQLDEVSPSNAARGVGIYCSVTCRAAANHAAGSVTVACKTCGRPFPATQSRINNGWASYCSKPCQYDARRTRVERACEICGDPFEVVPSTIANGYGRFCSRTCAGVFLANDPQAQRHRMRNLINLQISKNPTRCELVLYQLLDSVLPSGEWHRQYALFHWVVDAAIPSRNIVVQADGDYWHGRKHQEGTRPRHVQIAVNRDRSQDQYLATAGWTVLRLWESALLSRPDWCLEQINRVLQR